MTDITLQAIFKAISLGNAEPADPETWPGVEGQAIEVVVAGREDHAVILDATEDGLAIQVIDPDGNAFFANLKWSGFDPS